MSLIQLRTCEFVVIDDHAVGWACKYPATNFVQSCTKISWKIISSTLLYCELNFPTRGVAFSNSSTGICALSPCHAVTRSGWNSPENSQSCMHSSYKRTRELLSWTKCSYMGQIPTNETTRIGGARPGAELPWRWSRWERLKWSAWHLVLHDERLHHLK